MTCLRLNMSICRLKRAARSAAVAICFSGLVVSFSTGFFASNKPA